MDAVPTPVTVPERHLYRITEAMRLLSMSRSVIDNPGTVRQTCKHMADKDQLRTATGGTYHPPDASDTPSDTPAGPSLARPT